MRRRWKNRVPFHRVGNKGCLEAYGKERREEMEQHYAQQGAEVLEKTDEATRMRLAGAVVKIDRWGIVEWEASIQ